MDNHPIPQDVTGFQFKLVGDMTLKQFAYLAGGCIFAWIAYILPISAIIRFPLAAIFAGLGLSLAFLPLEGRPLDVMIGNYLKALFNPNIFIYQKTGGDLGFTQIHFQKRHPKNKHSAKIPEREKLKVFFHTTPKIQQTKLDEKEASFLNSLTQVFNFNALADDTGANAQVSPRFLSTHQVNPPKPKQELRLPDQDMKKQEDNAKKELEKEAVEIKKELEEAKREESKETGAMAIQTHQKVLELENELNAVLKEKQLLEQQLVELQKQLGEKPKETLRPQKPAGQSKNVREVAKDQERKVGTPITHEAPNLISGIVKDPRGNVLPNILIEVRDSENNPVRAFKTNGLGQFASATPLANGTYTIEFEDQSGKNKFDVISLTALGKPIPALEVISTDEREELRKALFKN